MNLQEEKKYQMREELFESLELTEENKKIAQNYLDITQEEKRELLNQVEKQNFTTLGNIQKQKSVEYINYLEKRNQKEELERYTRLIFAIGGSTCEKALPYWGYSLDTYDVLNEAQATSALVERIVSTSRIFDSYILKDLRKTARKDPEIIREAMEYCYNPQSNTRILLRAYYLNFKNPDCEESTFSHDLLKDTLKDINVKEDLKNQVAAMENTFTESLSTLFQGKLSEEEEAELKAYVNAGDITKDVPVLIHQLSGRKIHLEYLLCFLSGTAFLVIEHTKKAEALLKLLSFIDSDAIHRTCVQMANPYWFDKHEELLQKVLGITPKDYIVLSMVREQIHAVSRMVVQYPEETELAIKDLNADQYGRLLNIVKKSNPSLYQKIHSNQGEYFDKMANEVVRNYNQGKNTAKDYLLGIKEVDELRPFLETYKKTYGYSWNKSSLIQEAGKHDGEKFYQRSIIFLGLAGETYPLRDLVKENNVKEIQKLIYIFETENLPVDLQLEVAATVYDSYYKEQSQTFFIDEMAKEYAKKKDIWGDALVLASKQSNVTGRYLCIRFLAEHKETYKKELLACAADSSILIKELLKSILTECSDWEEEIKGLLSSKKSQERELAVCILKKWGVSKYQEEFTQALEKEKSKKVKELLSECLGVTEEQEETELKNDIDSIIKEMHKGGKKRKIQWAYDTPFITVHKKDGKEVSEEYLQAIALCYADMYIPGANKQAMILAENLNESELATYSSELFDKWLGSGAEAKKKWVLYFASIHGGDIIVPKLVHQINEWPKMARGAIASEAVKALALNGSQTALLTVDGISRKFKFKQVKSAAGEALEYAAKELGISKEELSDKIVPDLGFDKEAKQTFNYGERSFVVYLTPSLELEVFDENGKKLKNLPAPGKKDNPEVAAAAYESYKLMKKQMKTVITNQKQRLEMALSSERQWTVKKWKELFVNNPVMHQFAISLIWGVYNQDGLTDTFRYMEDGSFNTKDEDEFEFPEEGNIGLVHPIELDDETKEQWKEQLSDYEVTQAIDQLERTVYGITEEEKEKTVLTKFAGKLMNAMSLSGKLQALGWYRGSILDGGGYETFYKEDAQIAVELNFSGTSIGLELEDEITIYGVRFYKPGTVQHGSYVYDTIKQENLYTLEQVNPRYFSEIVYQLEKATASSTESVEVPEKYLI